LRCRTPSAAAGGLAGVVSYGLLEPKCLAGPLAQLPKEIFPIWFAVIGENRSIVMDVLQGNFDQSLGLLVYYALGLAAAWKHHRAVRAGQSLFLALAASVFVIFACWQYKYTAYASLFVCVPLALAVAALPAAANLSAGTIQACMMVLVSQAVLLQASKAIDLRLHPLPSQVSAAVPPQACLASSAVRDLAALPPGLVAARIDPSRCGAAFEGPQGRICCDMQRSG
jgi:hypothetical protein